MLDQIIDAIKQSESNGMLSQPEKGILSGLSGSKLIGTLQRLATLFSKDNSTCYLEVGVFQGLTLLSVANACNNFLCYGIDNFAYFDPNKKNLGIINERMSKLSLKNVNLINKDYEDALENLKFEIKDKKVGVYFIDGPHDYRSQLMCLELALPYLHDNAVILVDDCNYKHVRQANRDFLVTHPEYKLVFEAYTDCHPNNMSSLQEKDCRESWWNGVNILVRDLDQKLQPMYPPTERSRLLYENEHTIHASKIAEVAPEAVYVMQSMYELDLSRLLVGLVRFFRQAGKYSKLFKNRYRLTNTYSASLPASNYNKSVGNVLTCGAGLKRN